MVIPIHLATEDHLSEAVLRRLLAYSGRNYAVRVIYGRGGYGYLKKNIHGWNRAAASTPFLILTDLDHHECAPSLILNWLGQAPVHHNLLFRIAVREVESWLLGDSNHLARYLAVQRSAIPSSPDLLDDPKQTLIHIARRSRSREIRERVVPRAGSTAQQGPDYNGCLIEFVNSRWSINQAASNSPSLRRTIGRLSTFTPSWPEVDS